MNDHQDGSPDLQEVLTTRPETPLTWRKSSVSNHQGNCVEVAVLADGGVAVRNSRFPDGPRITYTRAEMSAFVQGVRAGEFDDLVS